MGVQRGLGRLGFWGGGLGCLDGVGGLDCLGVGVFGGLGCSGDWGIWIGLGFWDVRGGGVWRFGELKG